MITKVTTLTSISTTALLNSSKHHRYMYGIGNIILKARELPSAGLYLSNLKIACTIPFELLLVSVNFFSVKAFVTNW